MSFDEEDKQWTCGKVGVVNLQCVSSIVHDIREPCLHSPTKINKMLKPDKWQAIFDSDGRVYEFQKALKLIVLGGVDPSIRAEVWEFLLGCYSLDSTAEYRRQLRMARRSRYKDLLKQCQVMHSSVGTGSLAYIVGSKVMDMRKVYKDTGEREAEVKSRQASHDRTNKIENYCDWNNNCTDTSYTYQRECASDSSEYTSTRGSIEGAAYGYSHHFSSSDPYNFYSLTRGEEAYGSECINESFFDFPPLSFTKFFQNSDNDDKEYWVHHDRLSTCNKPRCPDENMHTFQISNNVDLIMESNGSPENDIPHSRNSKCGKFTLNVHGHKIKRTKFEYENKIVKGLRISDVPETEIMRPTTQGGSVSEDRVSEWLWTLHRIVVDVVRTDSHLEFYEDEKNIARMSDILAVYAWVDPATGYCQGMSDLLSPFLVLYNDDADAFWCFEMLIRRMRENFQMEGPTGVMKKLQTLWHILELTDREMFAHLSLIGAESLHFAFRMLMVLFRRELSFTEALCMWEMMWAADFDESVAQGLEEHCLEPLVVQISRDPVSETGEAIAENKNGISSSGIQSKHANVERSMSDNMVMKSASSHSLCGLTRNCWSRNDRMEICTVISSSRNGDDELPIFCVAAIIIVNRQKIKKETNSIDDMIKIFNDKMLKINVKRCIHTAIKLRKKYLCKLIKQKSPSSSE
ncbi:PREDICTED: small G protein signaling modulator 1-like isoform X2 [Nelumbo nucifera]|uniref:Rab-GAP TBC domain-containing protein n=2 Tax=Nelumbo nucifera TaxID=4432 RepID=A0A822ZE57_NELNU|nr:PREDICTED: small G protein signaling modulator 1-like isoform X2 [Nelumbo nucifera]DAD43422.1 TPA_asm: hypothetical protein HUJ06_001652 [Nelumbo nucifera]